MSVVVALLLAGMISAGSPAWFTDVTGASGIPPLKYAEGIYFQDMDGDGLPELFLPCVKGKDRLFENKGGMRFEDVTGARGLTEKDGIGAVFGDFNGDGSPDLYVVRGAYPYGLNVLWTGGGTFRDCTDEAGVAARKNGISASACDLDGDGRLDMFVSNWGGSTLYKNTSGGGKVSFADATKQAGLSDEGDSWGSVIADFNGDGLPDILVLRGAFGKYQEPKLFINQGGGRFRDEGAASGIKGVGWSMGAAAADFDGDGNLDLFITNYDGRDRIFFGDGRGHFVDGTAASGITTGYSIGAAAGDIDGDLRPDLVVAGYRGPVRLYRNLGGRRFKEVRGSGIGPYRKNEGVALADVDGDGALDLYVANYNGDNRLYRNNIAGGNYIKVRFDRINAGTAGAVARLYRAGSLGKKGGLLADETLFAGSGFCSQSPQELIFRLPDSGPYDLAVTLPGGKVIERRGVKPGIIKIEESLLRK